MVKGLTDILGVMFSLHYLNFLMMSSTSRNTELCSSLMGDSYCEMQQSCLMH